MDIKKRIIYFSLFSIAVISIAVVAWLVQEERIKLSADGNEYRIYIMKPAYNCNTDGDKSDVYLKWKVCGPRTGGTGCRYEERDYEITIKCEEKKENVISTQDYEKTFHQNKDETCSYKIRVIGLKEYEESVEDDESEVLKCITSSDQEIDNSINQEAVSTNEYTCSEKCQLLGSSNYVCRNYAVVPSVQKCTSNEIIAGTTSDCQLEDQLVGSGVACCCLTNFTFTVDSERSENNLILSWSSVPNASFYRIFTCNSEFIAETQSTSYTLNNIGNGTYCYIVFAYDENGNEIMNTARTNFNVTDDNSENIGADDVPPIDLNQFDLDQYEDINALSQIGDLISTGSNIWVNLILALILTGGVGYFVFKDKIYGVK